MEKGRLWRMNRAAVSLLMILPLFASADCLTGSGSVFAVPSIHEGDAFSIQWSPAFGVSKEVVNLTVAPLNQHPSYRPGDWANRIAFVSDGNWVGYQDDLLLQNNEKRIIVDGDSAEILELDMGAFDGTSGGQSEFPRDASFRTLINYFPLIGLPLTGRELGQGSIVRISQFGYEFEGRLEGSSVRFQSYHLFEVGGEIERVPFTLQLQYAGDPMPARIDYWLGPQDDPMTTPITVFRLLRYHSAAGGALAFGDASIQATPVPLVQTRDWIVRLPEGSPLAHLSLSEASALVEDSTEFDSFAGTSRLPLQVEAIYRRSLTNHHWELSYLRADGEVFVGRVSSTEPRLPAAHPPVDVLPIFEGASVVQRPDGGRFLQTRPTELIALSDALDLATAYVGGTGTLSTLEVTANVGTSVVPSGDDDQSGHAERMIARFYVELAESASELGVDVDLYDGYVSGVRAPL